MSDSNQAFEELNRMYNRSLRCINACTEAVGLDPRLCGDMSEVPSQIKARFQQAVEALKKIQSASWDSGSTPAPEVVSSIYCVATEALSLVEEKVIS